MKIIVGLGNPGKKYENTRHNIGFMVMDEIAKNPQILPVTKTSLEFEKSKKFQTDITRCSLGKNKSILVKPQTFMNNSGISVSKISQFYHIKYADIWVITDDVDLPLGVIRVRSGGSSGGHKGLQSIIDNLSTQDFTRIRVGIHNVHAENFFGRAGKSYKIDTETFVLEEFTHREKKLIENIAQKTAQIIIEALRKNQFIDHTYKVK